MKGPPMLNKNEALADMGRILFGLAGIALGALGLIWHDYAAVWQPVDNLIGDSNRPLFASVFAACELVAGIATLWPRTARFGAIVLAVVYLICVLGWIPRIIAQPAVWGVYNGVAEQLALVAAGIVVYANFAPVSYESKARLIQIGCVTFGLCAVSFAFGHFTAIRETTAFVPAWIPPSQKFWAWATGIFHLLAGVAILIGVKDVLASRLLTAMMIGFGVLVWAPALIAKPADHFTWAGNAINFALLSSAWVIADQIARRARPVEK
jgi:uncharacterized membrane protein YphA (DoxX/SURF4 family)